MNLNHFFKSYCWEALSEPLDINGKTLCNSLLVPQNIQKNMEFLHIFRDENYNIQLEAKGQILDFTSINSCDDDCKLPEGTLVNGDTIVCKTEEGYDVNLKNCIYNGYSVNYNLNSTIESSFTAHFEVYEIHNDYHKFFGENVEPDSLVEWYLNSVENSVLFSDTSIIQDSISRTLKNASSFIAKYHQKSQHYSSNCLYLEFNGTGLLLHKVSKDFGPKWSNNISIEYRSSYGKIPCKNERKRIAEFLSFLIGRQLILVGDTLYYQNSILESHMYNPYPSNPQAECQTNTREIIPVHLYNDEKNNFKFFAQKMLPNYLKICDTYNISDALARYWLANSMPDGVCLPILVGAIETIIKRWFKGNKSKSKGVYINSKDYEAIICSFRTKIDNSLSQYENKDKVLNKISNAYQMSVTDRYYIFLDEIGLKYGTLETNSFKARNDFTHGGNGKDYENTIKFTTTMFTLFGRIILKLLDYDGEYIDKTLLGFSRKNIDDEIGIEK